MTFDVEKINSGTITLPTGMTHQERREFIKGELIRLQEESPCTVCEETGYVDNPNYRTDRDNMALECPHCHGTGIEPEEDILTDNQLNKLTEGR